MSVNTVVKAIADERGVQFGPDDLVRIKLSSSQCPIINPLQSFLRFEVKLKTPEGQIPTACSLDDEAYGAGALIDYVEIVTMGENIRLETIQEWGHLIGTVKHYQETPSLRHQWSLQEGYSPDAQTSLNSLYYRKNTTASPTTYDFKTVQICYPLYLSGLLYGYTAFPNVALQSGIEVRIKLNSANQALVACKVGYENTLANRFCLGGYYTVAGPPVKTAGAIPAATNISGVYLCATGEADPAVDGRICDSLADCPYVVGDQLFLTDATPAQLDCGTITAITLDAGNIKIETNSMGGAGLAVAAGAPVKTPVYSTLTPSTGVKGCTYELTNLNMVCGVVNASPEYVRSLSNSVNGGGIEYPYKSYELYRVNVQRNVNKASQFIPCNIKRCKSILSTPYNSTDLPALTSSSFVPVQDGMSNYQYLLNAFDGGVVLTPSQRVRTDRMSPLQQGTNQIAIKEIEKGIGSCGWSVPHLNDSYKKFLVSRELAKDSFLYDASRGEDMRLNVEYGAGGATADKIFHHQVCCHKHLQIRREGINVDV